MTRGLSIYLLVDRRKLPLAAYRNDQGKPTRTRRFLTPSSLLEPLTYHCKVIGRAKLILQLHMPNPEALSFRFS
jgi:hypothetical protein